MNYAKIELSVMYRKCSILAFLFLYPYNERAL